MAAVRWLSTQVQGRRAVYRTVVRHEPPTPSGTVVFVHGWAPSARSYRRGLDLLASLGRAVLAPALPGFRSTAMLSSDQLSLARYGDWLVDFLDAVDVVGSVTLVGHSFGGAVAIKCAHDHPDRVAQLVLVNSIGGSTWSPSGRPRAMSDRPLGDWGVHLSADVLSPRGAARTLPVVAADVLTHALANPRPLRRLGRLARQANLAFELEELRVRGTPVVVVWGREDRSLPWACAESVIDALSHPEAVIVRGDNGWLTGQPEPSVEVLTNVRRIGRRDRRCGPRGSGLEANSAMGPAPQQRLQTRSAE